MPADHPGVHRPEPSQQNITTLNDLIKYTPNVTFGNNGPGQGVIFMRGLSAGLQGNQSSATIATFPNVALYLDDQSMQFPGRNVDIYAVDLERVEVLEGPQGTLFGGGAEAGAIRYITNKPKLERLLGQRRGQRRRHRQAAIRTTPCNAMFNIPLVADKLAVRAVLYDDHQGGYIDNVPSTFTRSNSRPRQRLFQHHAERGGDLPERPARRRPDTLCTPAGDAGRATTSHIAAQQLQPDRPTRARASRRCTRSTTTGTC